MKPSRFLLPVVFGSLLVWAYWPVLIQIVEKWAQPEYSHGYFVPVFAVVLLWLRRGLLGDEPMSPSWLGIAPLAVGAAMRIAGAVFYMEYAEELSILPCLFGLAICAGGRRALYWSWPAITFLFFMVPLPYTLEIMLSGPLRRVAVISGTYIVQTFGFPAVAEGNVILMENQPILVAEACSGLSMLLTFFALSTGIAMVSKRPFLDKIGIILSALPIAIVSNVLRITATAIVADTIGPVAATFFHDYGGYFMTPLALAFLGLELFLVDKLLVQTPAMEASAAPFDDFAMQFAPTGANPTSPASTAIKSEVTSS